MAVPDFQTLTLPLLKLASDGKEHTVGAARDAIADELELSSDDRKELLPSGRQTRLHNRIEKRIVLMNQGSRLSRTSPASSRSRWPVATSCLALPAKAEATWIRSRLRIMTGRGCAKASLATFSASATTSSP